MIPEYVQVRITRIDGDPAARVISSSYKPSRVPEVGQVATLVDTQSQDPDLYIVELVEADGRAKWIAWFREAELERV
ncbi:MAG TPA: hypothetical protein VEU73_14660 [Gemmatimonadales bacterium]|nr:hypothetical protein [Gemmatimonadales bacterium]